MSAEATRFVEGQKIELSDHPQYSLDLAPDDFYLIPSVKNKLRGRRFSAAKRPLMRSKCTFCRYPNQNGKSAIKIGSSVRISASVIMTNIVKSNRTLLNDGCLVLCDIPDTNSSPRNIVHVHNSRRHLMSTTPPCAGGRRPPPRRDSLRVSKKIFDME
ncbi:hypothetical protein EVAR_40499_1 [Eumeta japonica]|uniref:Uncharacterized protein n=1 Tax=Eumeta variegata TaxID=151549 RepID=A0A4C1XVX9_EUMVA|nr:hypothetical protein EVAR_40499_1 [Eumeta japonica]